MVRIEDQNNRVRMRVLVLSPTDACSILLIQQRARSVDRIEQLISKTSLVRLTEAAARDEYTRSAIFIRLLLTLGNRWRTVDRTEESDRTGDDDENELLHHLEENQIYTCENT